MASFMPDGPRTVTAMPRSGDSRHCARHCGEDPVIDRRSILLDRYAHVRRDAVPDEQQTPGELCRVLNFAARARGIIAARSSHLRSSRSYLIAQPVQLGSKLGHRENCIVDQRSLIQHATRFCECLPSGNPATCQSSSIFFAHRTLPIWQLSCLTCWPCACVRPGLAGSRSAGLRANHAVDSDDSGVCAALDNGRAKMWPDRW